MKNLVSGVRSTTADKKSLQQQVVQGLAQLQDSTAKESSSSSSGATVSCSPVLLYLSQEDMKASIDKRWPLSWTH